MCICQSTRQTYHMMGLKDVSGKQDKCKRQNCVCVYPK